MKRQQSKNSTFLVKKNDPKYANSSYNEVEGLVAMINKATKDKETLIDKTLVVDNIIERQQLEMEELSHTLEDLEAKCRVKGSQLTKKNDEKINKAFKKLEAKRKMLLDYRQSLAGVNRK